MAAEQNSPYHGPPIQMVDLVGQYQKIKADVDARMASVVSRAAFIRGPEVNEFERELGAFLGGAEVIACANGTDALQIALMALGLQPGDEVITPDFTFVATTEVVRLLGLVPVLVDVDPHTFNISPAAIKAAIGPNTRAIVPVHLFGQCADMQAIMAIAREHSLYVIEDNAQALGAVYQGNQAAGTIGDIGTTSFFPSKNLGCYGDGGALFTKNAELAQRIRSIANHGQGEQYYYDHIGVNSRLDTLQAAVLLAKLPRLTQYNNARTQAADRYDELLGNLTGITIPYREPSSTHIFHQYTLKIEGGRRDALMAHLSARGIPSKVYYPAPIHASGAYSQASRFSKAALRNTLALCACVLSLPMHTELSDEQQRYICRQTADFCG